MEGALAEHDLPAPGTLFAGRYRIERLLGVGGMGSVLLARHEVIGQYVALKLLHPEASSSPAAVERFVKEARAASKIEGQHVVHIYDVGTEAGRPYLCMEYLRGQDLGQIFDAHGPLPSHEVCGALLDAIIALAQAHSAGIVHRDLKPSNLFFAEQPAGKPVLKVLDFGIAKMEEGLASVHATSTGMIMGTPAYMAPEQMRSSKTVDARADIWALGVIAYELLTGRLPYLGDSLGDILFAVVEKPPPPPHLVRSGIDRELSAVVMKCLQRDPDRRFATVTELSDALEPFATASRVGTSAALRLSISGEHLSNPVLELENAKTEQLRPRVASPKTGSEWVTDSTTRPRRKTRVVAGVAGAAALLILGGVGLLASRGMVGGRAVTGAASSAPSAQLASAVSGTLTAAVPATDPAPLVEAEADPSAATAATNAPLAIAADAGLAITGVPAKKATVHGGSDLHKTGASAASAASITPPSPATAPAAPSARDGAHLTPSKGWEDIPNGAPGAH